MIEDMINYLLSLTADRVFQCHNNCTLRLNLRNGLVISQYQEIRADRLGCNTWIGDSLHRKSADRLRVLRCMDMG